MLCDTTGYKALGGLLSGVSADCGACGQCQVSDFFIVGNTITKLILGLSGSIMLLMVIYGGFLWLTSSGNSNLVDKGKKVLIGSIIGLIIVFGAYTSTQFILGALGVSNVAEVFTRPFQDSKGKVIAPKTDQTTTPAATPAATVTCNCVVAITNKSECAVLSKLHGVECNSASTGCNCVVENPMAASDCTIEKAIINLAPSATGSCNPL